MSASDEHTPAEIISDADDRMKSALKNTVTDKINESDVTTVLDEGVIRFKAVVNNDMDESRTKSAIIQVS